MSKITQQFQLLAPKAAAQNEVKTFVYSKDVIVKNSSTEEERLYSVLTIWAPTKDIDKIFAHLMQVFYKCCRIETSNESIMVRFNRTLESINTILEELSRYYTKKDLRFHVAGSIAIISGSQAVIGICNDAQTYLTRKKVTKTLFDPHSKSSKSNKFYKTTHLHLYPNDQIIFSSSRFSDRLPKYMLYNYLKDPGYIFFKLCEDITSLNSPHLGLINVLIYSKTRSLPTQHNVESTSIGDAQGSAKPVVVKKPALKHTQHRISLDNITKSAEKYILVPAKKAFKSSWNSLWSKYINSRPILSLAIFISILCVIIGLAIYFVAYNPHNQTLIKRYENWNKEVSLAESQTNQDKVTTLKIIDKTRLEINSLPRTDYLAINRLVANQKKQSLDDLLARLNSIDDKLNGIYRVNPEKVFEGDKTARFGPIALQDNLVYSVDTSSGSLWVTNINNSKTQQLASSPELGSATAITVSASKIVYILTNTGVYAVNDKGEVNKQSNTTGLWPSSAAISSYGPNLYLLSPADNQIYKYIKTNTSFGLASKYIKNPTTGLLKDATSFTVNGNVIVAERSGQILLFNQGVKQDFAITDAPSDLQNITSISYSSSPDRVIVLNQEKKALIDLSLVETGAQYKKEAVVNGTSFISSFIYDNKSNNVIFTSNNTIQKIPF